LEVETDGCASPVYRQTVEVKEGLATPKISIVTIDNVTGKNKIIWDKNNLNLTSAVTGMVVYKEGSRYNQFEPIGSVDPKAGEFVDWASNPQITTSRYVIAYNTIYNITSNQSAPHRSTHLMLNKGMGNSINLYWTPYEGGIIESYRIFRGATPETLSLLIEVSGNSNTYTDLTPPSGMFYYALEYDQTYNPEWVIEKSELKAPALRATASIISARSNAVSVVNAWNITMAQSLNILALEDELRLSTGQTELHLYAEIFPVTADYKVVNWLITEGAEYAWVNPQGLLTATGKTAENATIKVRATTIDGSNIWKEITIPYAYTGMGINEPVIDEPAVIKVHVYPNPAKDWIKIASSETITGIELIDLMGKSLFRKSFNAPDVEISIGGYPKGHYLLRITTQQGTVVRQIVKI
jgi:hypothetical protein